jgi:hypothetical protein
MTPFSRRKMSLLSLPLIILLSSCWESEPDCNAADTRESVIRTVSTDANNPLVAYAAETSDTVKAKLNKTSTDAEKASILEEAKQSASYHMGEQIITNSKSKIKGKVSCSGMLSATVSDTSAQKKIDFEVEKTPEGAISVWVRPFKFEAPPDPSRPNE